MFVQKNRNVIGASRIKLTYHSRDRSMERLNITSQDEFRKLAASARNKGVNVDALNLNNYHLFGIDYKTFAGLKRYFRTHTNSERMYYYRGFVYIFAGKDACTLKTVIPVRLAEDAVKVPTFA